jgi:hypothetical protein
LFIAIIGSLVQREDIISFSPTTPENQPIPRQEQLQTIEAEETRIAQTRSQLLLTATQEMLLSIRATATTEQMNANMTATHQAELLLSSTPSPTTTVTPISIPFSLAATPVPNDFSVELENQTVRQFLGGNNTDAALYEDLGAYQEYQNGVMIWLGIYPPDQRIFVLFPDGTYETYPDTWDGTQLNISVPDEFYPPINGFGNLWQNNETVRNRLGYPIMCEVAVNMVYQAFSRGILLRMHSQYHFTQYDCQYAPDYLGTTYMLFNVNTSKNWVLLHN